MRDQNSEFLDMLQSVVDEALVREKANAKKLGRVGYVETVADGVVRVKGMSEVAYGEMVYFPAVEGLVGFTCNLNKDSVDILLFGEDRLVKSGYYAVGKSHGLQVPVTKKMLGRIVDPLGNLVDEGATFAADYTANVNIKAQVII